jgi:glycosyltransferase involved in cell wall biosynthesis
LPAKKLLTVKASSRRPDMTLAVVSFNGLEVSARFLSQLPYWEQPRGFRLELVWVDNGSSDGTAALLRSAAWKDLACFERVRLLFLGRNAYISGAVNAALGLAEGRFFLQADNDVLLTPEAVQGFWESLVRRPGLVSPQWLFTQRLLPRRFDPVAYEDLDRAFRWVRWTAGLFGAEEGVSGGSCWAAPTSDLKRLGGWSEEFRLVGMDDDFLMRWLKAGLPARMEPLPVFHPGQKTRMAVGGYHALEDQDNALFLRRWGSYPWDSAPRRRPWRNRFLGHRRVARWLRPFFTLGWELGWTPEVLVNEGRIPPFSGVS